MYHRRAKKVKWNQVFSQPNRKFIKNSETFGMTAPTPLMKPAKRKNSSLRHVLSLMFECLKSFARTKNSSIIFHLQSSDELTPEWIWSIQLGRWVHSKLRSRKSNRRWTKFVEQPIRLASVCQSERGTVYPLQYVLVCSFVTEWRIELVQPMFSRRIEENCFVRFSSIEKFVLNCEFD